ncbi:MAG: pyrroloquinoline quinone-dependent dehydrogenase [Myxococcota bacterium]
MRPSLFAILTLTLACSPAVDVPLGGPVDGWAVYGRSSGGERHSLLTQIHPGNVHGLEPAWTYHHGDLDDGSSGLGVRAGFQATPILVDDQLVFCTPRNRVIALDAETGTERWNYDPEVNTDGLYLLNCRGVSVWEDPDPSATSCQTRVLTGTLDARLIALDAATGTPCEGFGEGGTVDLREGIGDTRPGEYGVTSPPVVIGDRVVTGAMVLDNRRVDAPGGVVRAWDVRTGERVWAWDPVPAGAPLRQAENGVRYRRGTTNAWTALSTDPELGLVYVPTGNTSPDYYGGQREGLDHFSSSLVALDASDGSVRWHFRTVHHDIWDYDVPSQPVFVDFPTPQGAVPGLIQATKMGHVFFLDRRSGEPLHPVEERPVPQDPAPGETLSATQPYPVRPPSLHPATLTPDDAFGFTPWDRGRCRDAIAEARSEGVFTPPSLQGTIQYPGMMGGANWGSGSVDPDRGLFLINTSRVATYIRLVPRDEFDAEFPDGPPAFGFEPQAGTPYALERVPLLSPFGAPCNPPPWGTLTAIDIESGEIRWDVPLGTTRDLAPFPIWWFAPEGVPNLGGPITTASGLLFIGATTDHYFRAFDTTTGEELWRARLPTSAQSTPMTYRLREDGRQFVVIAAGGHAMMPSKPGDALIAFALPERDPR